MPILTLTKPYTDQQLLDLIRTDDRGAFTELYNRYWDKTYAVALHRLDDEHEAEEVVQEVFLSIWQRRATLQLTHTVATYLSVAVKYKVINHLAKQHRRQLQHDELTITSPVVADSTADWLHEKELRQLLEKTVSQLPEKCRIVFLLSRDENKTYAEIAAELNISQKTVEAHMSKALRELRETLAVSAPVLAFILLNADRFL
ncbi:RNA polymerase sigma-70 factor [Mucilaginibacter sp. OK283]|uniref:RNA polymerase sigma-70 factor n=1 Tax=Mucilaginibacter sp. OK283 TaxID=1881049 RepID=UPI0008D6D6FD|nr:RNA polymerase sigma-70 factor [Mucilaginibacter sp. OK283]SEP29874.1 RNA polymerase sigma-70 factor, ECF subfamily [Mucilaginibacter sp. OK283]